MLCTHRGTTSSAVFRNSAMTAVGGRRGGAGSPASSAVESERLAAVGEEKQHLCLA